MNTYAKVRAPATIANFGPGFDVFGIALDEPYDIVEMELTDGPSTVDSVPYPLPTSVTKNVASYAALALLGRAGRGDLSFKMTVTKGVRPASGMGSSGASCVGGALAAAALAGITSDADIVWAAAQGEGLATGNPHPDNVAPSYHGGFVAVRSLEPYAALRIMPEGLRVVAVLPDIRVSTKEARAILPAAVPMADAVANVANASFVVHALMTGAYRELGTALEDRLSIPYRKALVTGYDDAKAAALDAGALAFSLGGSGPTVFAIVEDNGPAVADAISGAFAGHGIGSTAYCTKIGKGAQVLALE